MCVSRATLAVLRVLAVKGLSLNSVCFRSHSGSVAIISCEGLSFSSVCFRSHSGSVAIISCEGLSFSSVCVSGATLAVLRLLAVKV